MDAKENAILDSLRIHEHLRFNELLNETQNKTKISRQTFSNRLKDLQKDDWILKKKNQYELNFSKEDKKILKKTFASVTEFEREVKRFPRSNDPTGEGHKILKKIFHEYYIPTVWHLLCYKSVHSKNEIRQLEACIKRYQDGMKEMVKKLYLLNYLEANFFLQSPDLIFLKKGKK